MLKRKRYDYVNHISKNKISTFKNIFQCNLEGTGIQKLF